MTHKHAPAWITGVGALSCLGASFEDTAAGLRSGRSGIRTIEDFDVSQHPCQMAGQVLHTPRPYWISVDEFNAMLRLERCVLYCVGEALHDAGLWECRHSLRIGLALGIGAEWTQTWDEDSTRGGARLYRPELDREGILRRVVRRVGISGPAMAVAAACASGNHSLRHGKTWLEMGLVDVCIAGACDMGVTRFSMAAFGNLRALSRRNDSPAEALRPFDRARDGMVLGEGGGMFVLERAADAERRGATPYAQMAGAGLTSDAYHMVIPANDGHQASQAMQAALYEAGVRPDEIDYLNAHATGTPVGDVVEIRAIREALGPVADSIPISATKSMTGHLLSAAAAVEAVACIVAIRDQVIPPTINLQDIDPDCRMNHVANVGRPHPVRVALSNSFGFGGNNTALVLRAVA